MAEAGIARAVVNVHHKADLIEAHLKAREQPASRSPTSAQQLLDTGGGVKKALPRLGPGAFLIHNADSVWIEGVGSNLARLIAGLGRRAHGLPDAAGALASHSLGYQGRGDFAFESDGRIRRRRVEQEIVPFAFTGVSIAHPRLFDGAARRARSRSTPCGTQAIAAGRPIGMRMEGTVDACRHARRLAQAESSCA